MIRDRERERPAFEHMCSKAGLSLSVQVWEEHLLYP